MPISERRLGASEVSHPLKAAAEIMGRDPDRAVKIACEVLNDSPDDVDALMMIAYLFGKAGR